MDTTRREFLDALLVIAGAGLLAACGDDGSSGGDGGSPPTDGGSGTCNPTETIASNHGHAIDVTTGDVSAGMTKTYDIMGSASHSHDVTVTSAQFGMLAGGTGILVESTPGGSDGHTHSVTIDCA